ncbi:MAG: methylenetetrahydrofolate reductase [Bacillota bacterium]
MDLRCKLNNGKFTVTVEVDPPRGWNPTPTLEQVRCLQGYVDAINVADCPMANLRMSPIALAHLVQEVLGVETVFHLTCRDRNVLGLQAELLGAAALGVKNLLALSGDRPERGDHASAMPVYEVDSTGLVALASKLNQGLCYAGRPLDCPTQFFIGVAVNPNAVVSSDVELAKLKAKVEAGARFAQTQPVFDVEVVEQFHRIAEGLGLKVLYGVLPLKSSKSMNYLKAKVPGIVIPKEVEERMLKGSPNEGLKIGAELISQIRRLGRSVHLFPIGDPLLAVKVLELAG